MVKITSETKAKPAAKKKAPAKKKAAPKKTAAKKKPAKKAAAPAQVKRAYNTVPLSQLTAAKDNPRRCADKTAQVELQASIEAHGLLQSLVVRHGDKGQFEVIAGQRRLAALQALRDDGKIRPDYPVGVTVIEGENGVDEFALAENIVRTNMHPADEFEAFARLVDHGENEAAIAARFGVTEKLVKQRLKLANVSPKILQAYRDGAITLEKVMAFTVCDDHKAQEKVFDGLNNWDGESAIRDRLMDSQLAHDDRRVRFVGLDAYEAAGGQVQRDLFGDDIWITDLKLLEKLVEEKLQQCAAEFSGAGWSAFEIALDKTTYDLVPRNFETIRPETKKPTAAQKKTAADLDKKEKALVTEQGDLHEKSDWTDADRKRDDEIDKLLEDVEDARNALEAELEFFPDKVKAEATAFATIDHNGRLHVEYALAKKKAGSPKTTGDGKTSPAAEIPETIEEESEALSDALVKDLALHRGAAIASELAHAPDLAFKLLVMEFARKILYPGAAWEDDVTTNLDIALRPVWLDRAPTTSSGVEARGDIQGINRILEQKQVWLDRTPEKAADFRQWIDKQDDATLKDLLAFCLSLSLDDLGKYGEGKKVGPGVARVWTECAVDMTDFFTPSADNFFGRLKKPMILACIDDMRKDHPEKSAEKIPAAEELAKKKKADLAGYAEHTMQAGWLPLAFRNPKPADAAPAKKKAAK